jgi:subtilisin family serine protease
MSWVGRGYVTPSGPGCVNGNRDVLHTSICALTAAGVTAVAAAGNDHADADSYVPAAYDEVIAVSALSDSDGAPGGVGPASCSPSEADDAFATFSNYGSVIDIAGPGVCIESTFKNGGYRIMSGTSMAAPHVTGAAALLLYGNPAMRPEDVRSRLLSTQEPGPIPRDPDPFAEGVVRATSSTDLTTVSTGNAPGSPLPTLLPTPAANAW